MEIVEIFESISGEVGTNILQGEITNFIRFSGCSVGCEWCDTKYCWTTAMHLSVPDLITLLLKSNSRNLIVTGGEPFEQYEILPFLREARKHFKNIAIETSGYNLPDQMFTEFFDMALIVDYKPKSAKVKVPENSINSFTLFTNLTGKDVIKFPFMSKEDLDEAVLMAKRVIAFFENVGQPHPALAFCPILTDELHSYELFSFLPSFLLENKINGVINLQIHKILGAS